MRFSSLACKLLTLLPIVFTCAPRAHASASTTENWTVTGSGISGSGTITLTTTGNPAIDEITGITGSFSTTNSGGFSGAITGLNPGSYSGAAPTGPDALGVSYDNLFYPAGSPSPSGCVPTGPANVLDYCGVDFLVTGGYEANIYGSNATNGYSVIDGKQNGTAEYDGNVQVSFSVSPLPATPIPPSVLLTMIGLACVGFYVGCRGMKLA